MFLDEGDSPHRILKHQKTYHYIPCGGGGYLHIQYSKKVYFLQITLFVDRKTVRR